MSLDVLDISIAAIRSVTDALESQHHIELTKMPLIQSEEVLNPRIVGLEDDCIALRTMEHKPTMSTGFIAIFMTKKLLSDLIQNKGKKNPNMNDVIESSSDFCDVITDNFKKHILEFGFEDLLLNSTRTFTEGVNEPIPYVFIDKKYILKFEKLGRNLLELQIGFESLL